VKPTQRIRNEKRKTRSICIPQNMNYEQLTGYGENTEKGLWKLEADPRVSLWQRDKELYEAQSKTMLHQIMVLTIQLDEAKGRANECTSLSLPLVKRLLENLKTNKSSKTETLELIDKIERKGSDLKNLLDSSMDSL